MAKERRRFGAHEVKKGRFKGGLHVSTPSYRDFIGELFYLREFITKRFLPSEPEEVEMQGTLTNLQNILEHETEELIRYYINQPENDQDIQFQQKMDDGYISFKAKCDWLLARSLLSQDEWEIMDKVRELKNKFVQSRPITKRRRFRYKDFPLLTRRSVRQLFVDVELVLRKLRRQSNRKSIWMIVPPGYASEVGWPEELVEALESEIDDRG
jgi:hypothetical protein